MVSREEMERALAERHGKELYEKFSSAAVAVCGLGGLGSNIAVSLIRAGVGRLILFDFDRVDITESAQTAVQSGSGGQVQDRGPVREPAGNKSLLQAGSAHGEDHRGKRSQAAGGCGHRVRSL